VLLIQNNEIRGNGPSGIPFTANRKKILIGIELGAHPWVKAATPVTEYYDDDGRYQSYDLKKMTFRGGRITNNRIWDAQVGVNIAGAGTADSPTYVFENYVMPGTTTAPGIAFNHSCEDGANGYSADYFVTNASSSNSWVQCLFGGPTDAATAQCPILSQALRNAVGGYLPNWGVRGNTPWWSCLRTAGNIHNYPAIGVPLPN
jgi:hypothetical protein